MTLYTVRHRGRFGSWGNLATNLTHHDAEALVEAQIAKGIAAIAVPQVSEKKPMRHETVRRTPADMRARLRSDAIREVMERDKDRY